MRGLSSFLLAISALALIAGAVLHAAALPSALPVIDGAQLPPFHAGTFKALWLNDSATLAGVGAVFAFAALRSDAASPSVLLLLALIPAASGVSIYSFLGPFFAGHILVGSAAAAGLAALLRLRPARQA